jgi:hypothetical protein
MKVTVVQVQKLTIREVEDLDPVNVFIEDYGPGRGKTTIECRGEAWSYYWNALGEHIMAQFLLTCDADYLVRKFAPQVRPRIIDDSLEELERAAKARIIIDRRNKDLTHLEAELLWDQVKKMDDVGRQANHVVLSQVFGGEWYYSLPTKPNPDYLYPVRIIRAAWAGVRAMQEVD